MFLFLLFVFQIGISLRILLRPHREPASRIAWLVVVFAIPLVGVLAYFLLGETNIGKKRVERMNAIVANMPKIDEIENLNPEAIKPSLSRRQVSLFNVGNSISGFSPVGGNNAELMANSNSAIDRMVSDIDNAIDHVHLLFYIWMPDNNGKKVADALQRAAQRGVTCRAMVDDIGSRLLIKSPIWTELSSAGVKLGRALPVGNPLLRVFNGRVDLRNHRKILIIDNKITYCGSQNCADPEFLTKKKYAPWVDAVMRFTGPVVRQNQFVFASDWMAYVDEDIREILRQPIENIESGFPAQVVATGPTARFSAAPEMFESLMYSAQNALFITTPYYVPVGSMQAALCAAANRGVDTTIIFPARNDDFAVGATSRSYYEDLLTAGVKIYEYEAGLLHTKSLTLDNEITFIGSANMDRRSFELNYENNILLCDADVTKAMRQRQQEYLVDCKRVSADEVAAWSWKTRLKNNALAVVGPLL